MSNQDRAKKLIDLAKQQIQNGQYTAARDLLNKSIDEYDTNEATNLLFRVEALIRSQPRSQSNSHSSSTTSNQSNHPSSNDSTRSSSHTNQSTGRPFMHSEQPRPSPLPQQQQASRPSVNSNPTHSELPSDDEAASQYIISLKTHYEVLRVSQDAPLSEIKKSYRKLSLRFHPDKCNAPSSESCFKVITEANRVLSDERLRSQYNYTLQMSQRGGGGGMSERGYHTGTNQRRQFRFSTTTDEITPEQLFNMFFFPKEPFHRQRQEQQQAYQRRQQQQRRQRQNQAQDDGLFSSISHFIPFILLLIITLLSFPTSSPSNEISYSFERSSQHFIERTTGDLKAPYYVNNNFDRHFSKGGTTLQRFEQSINDEYYKYLMRKCKGELHFSKSEELSKNCKLFQDFEAKRGKDGTPKK